MPTEVIAAAEALGDGLVDGDADCIGAAGEHLQPPAQREAALPTEQTRIDGFPVDFPYFDPAGFAGLDNKRRSDRAARMGGLASSLGDWGGRLMAGPNGMGISWLDGLPTNRIDAAQTSGRGPRDLDCDEIGASCQKAQALAKGNPALSLEGFG